MIRDYHDFLLDFPYTLIPDYELQQKSLIWREAINFLIAQQNYCKMMMMQATRITFKVTKQLDENK